MMEFSETVRRLETGRLRVARKEDGCWKVDVQVKEAILEGFRAGILKDRNIAEDMAQDVFLSLWKHREELWCQNGTLKHFLFKACKNRVIDYLKSRYSRSHTPLADNDIPYLESSDSRAVYNQLQKDIADRVREMPAKRRDVFLMSRIESLSRKEIAERMDISEATVKKHIELALKQIRESDILKPNS